MFQRIVIPLDGSLRAEEAIPVLHASPALQVEQLCLYVRSLLSLIQPGILHIFQI